MPTYDYKCDKCGHQFEVFQSMKDDRLTDCPVEGCGGSIRRLLGTGAGIIFKGSGFYQTDYRSDSYKKAAKADSGTSSSSGGGSGSGSSSTPSSPPSTSSGSTSSSSGGSSTSGGGSAS
ncbi:MAG: zinc ribbon domain-containing protein [Verrucomicrobiae bacterium]|nr:zinc ribbon domain-containing protein [Verrucomicrobiae bacterium]MCB1091024.1 zinc ribbon domain-containing protein [Verrucomicrobiae bacterium]